MSVARVQETRLVGVVVCWLSRPRNEANTKKSSLEIMIGLLYQLTCARCCSGFATFFLELLIRGSNIDVIQVYIAQAENKVKNA